MASIINASTSSGLVTTADTSGILQLQSNGTTIATIGPTGLSTQVGSPAFSAYPSTGQSFSQSTWTKITLGTEAFDTNNNFASSTFTPTVAGYYQINGSANPQGTGMSQGGVAIYKNGSAYQYVAILSATITGSTYTVSSLIYLNGTTDYVDLYVFSNGTSPSIGSAQANVQFNGFLARSA